MVFCEVMGSLWWPVLNIGLGFGPGGPEGPEGPFQPEEPWDGLVGLACRAGGFWKGLVGLACGLSRVRTGY